MIVNKYAEALVIVAQERVGASFSSDSQRFARGVEWQRQHGNGLKCRGVFGQRSVM
jgi:hypothetical protein